MDKVNTEQLRVKIDLLEKLLSGNELKRISVSKRLLRIRKQLSSLIIINKWRT